MISSPTFKIVIAIFIIVMIIVIDVVVRGVVNEFTLHRMRPILKKGSVWELRTDPTLRVVLDADVDSLDMVTYHVEDASPFVTTRFLKVLEFNSCYRPAAVNSQRS